MARSHSAYYIATGIWPLVHMRSFELVAGRKKDRWLVRTVGVLVTAIGAGIGLAQARLELTPSMRILAMFAAAGLAGIDIYYAGTGRIRRVYLVDAAIEVVLALVWARSLVKEPVEASGRPTASRPHNDEVASPEGPRL